MTERPEIAVIGAGLCGLRVAERLKGHAHVTVFEKSRGLGGRMSTRRTDMYQFDHGAQYFTVRDPRFEDFLAPYRASGVVGRWEPRIVTFGSGVHPAWTVPRYVAAPAMNSLCKEMGRALQIELKCRIAEMKKAPSGRWTLIDEDHTARGPFDWVVSTAPAEQSAKLLPVSFRHHPAVSQTRMEGCYSLMLGGLALADLDWDAAVVTDGPLAWIAANHTKPSRADTGCLVCQSRNDWAEEHIENDPKTVQAELGAAVKRLVGIEIETAQYVSLHKWRFAKPASVAGAPCLIDNVQKLAAAGDWCFGARVESAFLSAEAVSDGILNEIKC